MADTKAAAAVGFGVAALAALGVVHSRLTAARRSGLRADWRERLDACFQKMLDNGKCDIPGVVAFCARRGQVYHKAFGMADKERGIKMDLDAQFRIFSMTKVCSLPVCGCEEDPALCCFCPAPLSASPNAQSAAMWWRGRYWPQRCC